MAYQGFRLEVLGIWIPAANGMISAQPAMTLQITPLSRKRHGAVTRWVVICIRRTRKTMVVITGTFFRPVFFGRSHYVQNNLV